ncbi:hypothetical protein FF36_05678 [Frankia torreyi]|uniref:Uncharacterized protein n=1 Tax=Frankia torreyi TaxID=1856 RepID=A0A0D8B7D1_9ACTN|nr:MULTISPECIES: pilin [Frankia]KJE20015.1 hypothetical protein FF36_05678 [Frankia torreyi]
MSRPVSSAVLAVARSLDVVRRGAARIAVAVRGRYDAAPGWVRRLLRGVAGLLLAAAAAGAAVGLSLLTRRLGGPVVAVRVWGTAGLVQLAAGGVLALALVTLDGDHRGDGRLDRRGAPPARGLRLMVGVVTVLAVIGAVLLAAGVAHAAGPAAPPAAPVPAVTDLNQVITNMRNWLMGILAGAATLFGSVGGLRYMGANGDPAEVERAKGSFKAAGIGYALAILAPVLLTALRSVVGG